MIDRSYLNNTILRNQDIFTIDPISRLTFTGSRVSVVGLPLSKLNPVSCTIIHRIEVVNIEPLSHPVPHLVPHSLREVCSAREQSPWQLINLLAFCVTPDTLPQGSYHALKQVGSHHSSRLNESLPW